MGDGTVALIVDVAGSAAQAQLSNSAGGARAADLLSRRGPAGTRSPPLLDTHGRNRVHTSESVVRVERVTRRTRREHRRQRTTDPESLPLVTFRMLPAVYHSITVPGAAEIPRMFVGRARLVLRGRDAVATSSPVVSETPPAKTSDKVNRLRRQIAIGVIQPITERLGHASTTG